MKRLEWPEFGLDPTPLQIAASLMFCFGFSYCRLRRARPRRADAIRGWSDCGEASAKVSVAAKTTSPRVRNRTNGSRTRLPSELELAIFTSRFVSTLYIVQDVFCCWRLAGIHVVLFICDSLTILNFYFFQYLGCVEVYESRGMPVCEEALKVLRVKYSFPLKRWWHKTSQFKIHLFIYSKNRILDVDQ